jgi:signal transduction histidine kinase
VHCDPDQIQQVLVALVINAIEATPNGGVVYITSSYQTDIREISLQVQDEGAGIPEDLLPRLFEPFFTTKEAGHSMGLGLAVSQSIIERHQGRIKVQSTPGGGTTFTVILPLDSETLPLEKAELAVTDRRQAHER